MLPQAAASADTAVSTDAVREPGHRQEVTQQPHVSSNQAVRNHSAILGQSQSTTRRGKIC